MMVEKWFSLHVSYDVFFLCEDEVQCYASPLTVAVREFRVRQMQLILVVEIKDLVNERTPIKILHSESKLRDYLASASK